MGLVFLKVIQMSMAASLLMLVVMAIRIFCKKIPKWFMGVLWAVVALRLLVPVQIESHIGFMPDFESIVNDTFNTTAKVPVGAEADRAIEAVSASASVQKTHGILFQFLGCLWITGVLMVMAYAVCGYISIKIKTRASIRFKSYERVYVCDDIDTPFIFGLIKPIIYLPSGIDHETTVNVIAHEKAHLLRRDHLRKQFGFMVVAIHWFNPLVWISYMLFCMDIELACDERVISTMSAAEKKSYAESLLNCSTGKRHTLVYPVAFGEVGVGTRVREIFNYRKPSFYLVMLLVIVTGVLATSSFTRAADKSDEAVTAMAKKTAPAESKESLSSELQTEDNRQVSVQTSGNYKKSSITSEIVVEGQTEIEDTKKEKLHIKAEVEADVKKTDDANVAVSAPVVTDPQGKENSETANAIPESSSVATDTKETDYSSTANETTITEDVNTYEESHEKTISHVSVEATESNEAVEVKEGNDSVKADTAGNGPATQIIPGTEMVSAITDEVVGAVMDDVADEVVEEVFDEAMDGATYVDSAIDIAESSFGILDSLFGR